MVESWVEVFESDDLSDSDGLVNRKQGALRERLLLNLRAGCEPLLLSSIKNISGIGGKVDDALSGMLSAVEKGGFDLDAELLDSLISISARAEAINRELEHVKLILSKNGD